MTVLSPSGSQYTDEQRIQAVAEYAIKGVATKVAESLNIPARTIQQWLATDWAQERLAQIRASNQDEHIALYHRLARKGAKVAFKKLPEASAKDAMMVSAIATDKARLLLNQPTSIKGNGETVDKLMKEFRKLSEQWEEKQTKVVATQHKED